MSRKSSIECFARCTVCGVNFRLGVSVPCPLNLYLAAMKIARCPKCGKRGKNLDAWEPGRVPPNVYA